MIQTVKRNDQLRQEYHILPAALMDAMDEGEARGLAKGSRQKALETAKTILTMVYPLNDICTISGLSQAEVEAL